MKKLLIAAGGMLPFFALAQMYDASGPSTPLGLVQTIGDVVNGLIPIAIAAAVLFFFWGLARYILSANDEAKKKDGMNIMFWGLIALFVMMSVWGIVRFFQNQLLPGQNFAPPPGLGGSTTL